MRRPAALAGIFWPGTLRLLARFALKLGRSSAEVAELKDLADAAGRRIRYLDQNAEIGDQVEYGTVVLERFS